MDPARTLDLKLKLIKNQLKIYKILIGGPMMDHLVTKQLLEIRKFGLNLRVWSKTLSAKIAMLFCVFAKLLFMTKLLLPVIISDISLTKL